MSCNFVTKGQLCGIATCVFVLFSCQYLMRFCRFNTGGKGQHFVYKITFCSWYTFTFYPFLQIANIKNRSYILMTKHPLFESDFVTLSAVCFVFSRTSMSHSKYWLHMISWRKSIEYKCNITGCGSFSLVGTYNICFTTQLWQHNKSIRFMHILCTIQSEVIPVLFCPAAFDFSVPKGLFKGFRIYRKICLIAMSL